MGPSLLAFGIAAALAVAPSAEAQPSPTPSPSPRASASPQAKPGPAAKPAAPRRKLDLGPSGQPGAGPPKPAETTSPRFESQVEVPGKAPLPDPNQTMAVWWEHFDFTSPAIYGYGSAYGLQAPQGSVNLLPLVKAAAQKNKDSKRNRPAKKAPPLEASPSPSPKPSSSPKQSPSPKPSASPQP